MNCLWVLHPDWQHRREQVPREWVSSRTAMCEHCTSVSKMSAVSHIPLSALGTSEPTCHQTDALTFIRLVTETKLSPGLILSHRKEIFTRWHIKYKHSCIHCRELKESEGTQWINWISKSGNWKSLWFIISPETQNRNICLYLFEVYLTPSVTFSKVPLASDNFPLCFLFDP